MKFRVVATGLILAFIDSLPGPIQGQQIATGIVFHDEKENRVYDTGEAKYRVCW